MEVGPVVHADGRLRVMHVCGFDVTGLTLISNNTLSMMQLKMEWVSTKAGEKARRCLLNKRQMSIRVVPLNIRRT